MNLNSFHYVVEIARCGSINQAAQNLYISQSNLSSTVKNLERELGFSLFQRNSQGVVPTSEGYLFLQSANAVIAELRKIEEIPLRLTTDQTISISCNWSAQLLQGLMQFKKKDPLDIKDVYRETSILQNFECLYENKYRLAIIDCFHSLSELQIQKAKNTNLDAELLKECVPAMALMASDHPLAGRQTVTTAEVYSYPLILFEDYRDTQRHNLINLSDDIPILYLFDRGSIIDALSNNTQRISILKKGTFVRPDQFGMVEIPISDFPESYDIVLLKRSHYQPNPRETEFMDYIKELFKTEL